MTVNPLKKLEALGQSIWLDYIKRDLFDGKLKKLIDEDGLRGMTSNPDIFEKSIGEGNEYDNAILELSKQGLSVGKIYNQLTEEDVGRAADIFRPVFDNTKGLDGYVSIEVNPDLAYDTLETIKSARQIWQEVNRPNIFIKVPATKEGLPAIKQLISEGINVNITLLFGLTRYQEVVDAYLSGIEERTKQNKPVREIASVASFFLSRIDTLIDPLLEKIMAEKKETSSLAKALHGEIAVACAKEAYVIFTEVIKSSRYRALEKHGIRPQRLLWASTSTKNPAYSDVKYIDSIIAPNTVNTVPMAALLAYRDHGKPEIRINQDVGKAKHALRQLKKLNIDLDQITQQLETEGVSKFKQAYDKLTATLTNKMKREDHS